MTWGDESDGGDSRSVQAELSGVQTIYATSCTFAAVLEDGTVVTWGYKSDGGDSSSVQVALNRVETIYSTSCEFAAVLQDGMVVTRLLVVTPGACRLHWTELQTSIPLTVHLPQY